MRCPISAFVLMAGIIGRYLGRLRIGRLRFRVMPEQIERDGGHGTDP